MVDDPGGLDESGPRLNSADFTRLFPFYLEIEANGIIRKAGPALMCSCPGVQPGRVFTEVIAPLRPEEPLSVAKLRNSPEVLWLIQDIQTGLRLRGQWLAGVEGRVIFVGSPWLSEAAEMSSHNLSVNDFAIHDPAVDLLHILRTQKMATDDLRRLTEKLTAQSAKLKQTNARIVEQEAESRKLALIAARTHNAVILTDAQGRTEWVNQGFSRLTGYTFEEIKGRSPGSLLQGPDTSSRRPIGLSCPRTPWPKAAAAATLSPAISTKSPTSTPNRATASCCANRRPAMPSRPTSPRSRKSCSS